MARIRGRRTRQPEIDAAPAWSDGIAVAGESVLAGEAFARIYYRYFDGVYRYCYRQLRDEQRAQDAAQQVFTNALEAFARYHEDGRLRQWLFTIAHNVIDGDRRKQRPAEPLDLIGDLPGHDATPEDAAIADASQRELLEAIARLPKDQRRTIELRIQGKTGKEIAQELGRTHDEVRQLIYRAMKNLKTEFGGTRGREEADSRDA